MSIIYQNIISLIKGEIWVQKIKSNDDIVKIRTLFFLFQILNLFKKTVMKMYWN